MGEFRLYFPDGDDAHAAQHRIEHRFDPINSLDDVRTDLAEWLERRGSANDPLVVAREYQERLRAIEIKVAWPVARDDPGADWELVVEAESIENVQSVVGVDLDYKWEGE
jgi:hypothetical protein